MRLTAKEIKGKTPEEIEKIIFEKLTAGMTEEEKEAYIKAMDGQV